MIRQDTLSEAPDDIQPDLAGGQRNWLRKVIAESTQAKVGLIVLTIFVLISIFAPLVAPYDPRQAGRAACTRRPRRSTSSGSTTAGSTCCRC